MNSTHDDDVRFSNFLAERYKNFTRLAEGGMGVVYRATDPMLGIDVAIKILKSENSVLRFQQEARAVAKLHHENVIRELDCGVLPDNSLYIVMEYQDGINLDVLLEKRGRMTVERALPIFKQIAAGMAHAHSLGILHRDLKPSNIIVVDSPGAAPIVKIVDFGLAVTMSEQDNEQTTLIGSPLYMAPETSREKLSDERSDIYSFGCLMMECLTLNPPFTGKTPFAVMVEHRDKKPPLLSERLPMENIPARLEDLIDKCLCKEREERYQSMDALLKELESIEAELNQKKMDSDLIELTSKGDAPTSISAGKTAGKSMMLVWVSVVVLACIIGLGCLVAPELMSILKPSEPAKMPTAVLEGEKEGDQLIESVLKDKFGEMDAIGGRWTFNKPGTVDDDFKDLAGRKDILRTWFIKSEITGSGLAYLKQNKLTSVAFIECMVNEAGMKQVAEFPSISVLRLTSAPALTDDALKWILKLRHLKTLYLVDDESLTDKCVDIVVQLPEISRLSFQGLTQVDSDSVEKLARLKDLTYLSLQKTGVKEPGLAHLSKLKKLVALDLSDLHVTDEQLDYVALPKLEMLVLRNSNVTFDGIKKLQKCTHLRVLDLRDCPCITGSKLSTLKELFPKVEIFSKGHAEYHNVPLENDDVLRYVQQSAR